MILKTIGLFILSLLSYCCFGQEVPILSSEIDDYGNILLEVSSNEDQYYILVARHATTGPYTEWVSMTLGKEGTTVISESLSAYPTDHYQVLAYDIATPHDTDGDGIDDITEFNNQPFQSPINYAQHIDFIDGVNTINTLETFNDLSREGVEIPWAPFLNHREFVKFAIVEPLTDTPEIYFINTNSHPLHWQFYQAVEINTTEIDHVNGEIIYYPNIIGENGNPGVFSFAYSEGNHRSFEITQRTNEILAANMPFLKNNFTYLISENSEENYIAEQTAFDNSRVSILLENEVYVDLDYLALNEAEGYGLLREMDLDDTPGARDIVIYESIPNNLPRTGGIISGFTQTPLSHVNLRAIQDNIPNSYIKNPLENEAIEPLLDRYVYYKVAQEEFTIREATLDEVNAWHEDLRPQEEQHPPLNLDYKTILPLEDVGFEMSNGFGAKCTNVATMRTFGFPEQTIPDGFGVPFYFYQEFMKFNGFFGQIETMLQDPDFINDLDTRLAMLDEFRDEIKDGDMPQWMLEQLQAMHDSFPAETSIRCRSSTNNEDLPGFSGAGLYSSKTQDPDEGHISKSIKQVYASMWNFRAFDARDYYRVNHYEASMGVLCHPNFKDELANGVGISTDPIFETEHTFYLNTQVGEDLITNPESNSIPEEMLLNTDPQTENEYTIIRFSNQVPNGTLTMSDAHRNELLDYLTTIHEQFAILYNEEDNNDFAMDIEYKITSENYLSIKQARPWAAFRAASSSVTLAPSEVIIAPNPASFETTVYCECDATKIRIVNLIGQTIIEQEADFKDARTVLQVAGLHKGLYSIQGISIDDKIIFSKKLLID